MKPKFKIFSGYDIILPEIGKFPGGEIRVKVDNHLSESVLIEALLLNSDDIMTLVMLTDALRNLGVKRIRLTMPYIPYARQDRVCNVGEAFSIQAFAAIINSLKFNSVVVYDAHSEVSISLIHNCINVHSYKLITDSPTYGFISACSISGKPLYLICPDKGAIEKSKAIAKEFPEIKGIVYAEKVRNPKNGEIIRTEVKDAPDDFVGSNMLICDDICDGGRTFIELAKVLQQYTPNALSLHVTHGIFSKGLDVLYDAGFTAVFSVIKFSDYQ